MYLLSRSPSSYKLKMSLKFKTQIRLKFREADPAQIMYFANVFSLAHDTFEEFIVAAGYRYEDWFSKTDHMIPIRHAEREHGGSSYCFKKLMNLAFDTMIAFSDKPLRLTVKLGFVISLLSFLFALYVIFSALTGTRAPLGWTSLMVAVTFFSGLIILIIGINGLYISRIFDEVKGRPLYIINRVYEHAPAAEPSQSHS